MTQAEWRDLIAVTLSWLVYCVVHSALASLRIKRWFATRWPGAKHYYRLGYNIFALLALLPILWLMVRTPSPMLWAWTGAAAYLANGLALGALFGFRTTLAAYDALEFVGWRQLSDPNINDADAFRLSPLHRHVRHPWYFLGLLLIWTRDMNAVLLVSAVAMTLYLIVGSRLEERKLVHAYGEPYRLYMERVPGLLPWPGKSISAEEAADLAKLSSVPR